VTIQINGLKVDYSTIDIKLNGLQMPTIKEIRFCDSLEPTAKSVPIGKTKGSYHAEITFEISPTAWQSFRHMLPDATDSTRAWYVGNRCYHTLYGARAASRFWRLPVEPR